MIWNDEKRHWERTPAESAEQNPRKTTRWHNPTSFPQAVTFHDGTAPRVTTDPETGHRRAYQANVYVTYRIEPGGSADIPCVFDAMIHQLDKLGNIAGGSAPLLVRADGSSRPLSEEMRAMCAPVVQGPAVDTSSRRAVRD